MAIAHIVVEIEELPMAKDTLNIRLTYSGGNDLETEEGQFGALARRDKASCIVATSKSNKRYIGSTDLLDSLLFIEYLRF